MNAEAVLLGAVLGICVPALAAAVGYGRLLGKVDTLSRHFAELKKGHDERGTRFGSLEKQVTRLEERVRLRRWTLPPGPAPAQGGDE